MPTSPWGDSDEEYVSYLTSLAMSTGAQGAYSHSGNYRVWWRNGVTVFLEHSPGRIRVWHHKTTRNEVQRQLVARLAEMGKPWEHRDRLGVDFPYDTAVDDGTEDYPPPDYMIKFIASWTPPEVVSA